MKSDNGKVSKKTDSARPRLAVSKKAWQPMTLTYAGKAKDVVQQGGGKISPSPSDPGEPRKVPSGVQG